jgi:type III restriction enzyme
VAAPGLPLKSYQTATIAAVRKWLSDASATGDADASFYKIVRRAYQEVAELPGVPYACLRVPTGGGKTLIASHLLGIAADAFLKTDMPVALWLVPSNAIREQTLKALTDRSHPYRQALAERFGENVRVMTIGEALYAKRPDYDGGAAIIVGTLQSFRVTETEGRKVYDPNGELMDHFTGLTEVQTRRLETGEGGTVLPSLCNVLKLRRPLVIVDEAHNARTALSFATLARLDPSIILELTATPAPDSNILHQVSAAELKADQMIKLPIVLRGRPDWKETVADAIEWLDDLTAIAAAEEAVTGEYIRPVMLLQAQPKRKDAFTITPEVLRQTLIDDFLREPEQIAIATGTQWELDGLDLASRDCAVRYVITVQALREGWDCPNAYVLCTVAEQRGERAVEQVLGRVMRLPKAKTKLHPELNQAYAFAATQSFKTTADALAEGLVANGFEKIEARDLIRAPKTLPGLDADPPTLASAPIAEEVDLEPMRAKVSAVTSGRVRLNVASRRFETSSPLSKVDAASLRLVVTPGAADALEDLIATALSRTPAPDVAESFSVPLLCVRRAGQLEIFDRGHFLDHPWALDRCDPRAVAEAFVLPDAAAQEARLDITAAGRIGIEHVRNVQEQLALALDDKDWTMPALVRWLDRRLSPVTRPDVTQKAAQGFIRGAIEALGAKGHSVGRLARLRFRLVDLIGEVIKKYRGARETQDFESCLFGSALTFETSSNHVAVFDPATYWPDARQLYDGRHAFTKHIRPDRIGAMNGEEAECALALDQHRKVKRWVRILDRMPGTFRIAKSGGWFYPDFVAELTDGRFLVVEYKGEQLTEKRDTEEKQMVGDKWAASSGGTCLFVMAMDRDYAAIARKLA